MTPEDYFQRIAQSLNGIEISQMFGKPCLKVNGKAFACYFHESMVFKLSGEAHGQALSIQGSQLFDPSGKGRPMKEWVQVPFNHHTTWKNYAEIAREYVIEQTLQ